MNKSRVVAFVSLALNVALLLVLGFFVFSLHNGTLGGRQGDVASTSASEAGSQPAEDAAEVMGAGADNAELDAWIDNMKLLAQEHQVNPYFLQQLFPEQIVYSFNKEIIYAEVDDSLPKHGYNWDNLSEGENGVLTYAEEGGLEGLHGVDVSRYQGAIDWEKVKAAGVKFAFLRVGYRGYETGKIMLDENFEDYIEGATEAGMPIGVYFFSQAANTAEALEEAEFVLEAVKDYQLTWPVVFDMEQVDAEGHRTEHLTAAEATDIAIAFCDKVAEAGYTPMIYGNVSWFLSMTELSRLHDYDKWFAQYRPMPYYPYEFTIWQYSQYGIVDGIEDEVDLNIAFKDYGAA